jgi:archaellum biogenesis protein FlaJ (TadC family)
MTPEAQRIAIAEACGWTEIRYHKLHAGNEGYLGSHVAKDGVLSRDWVPDYLNDLNAMREVERTIPYVLQTDYLNTLADVLGVGDAATNWSEDEWGIFKMVSATASQRAEAFLRTLNLWKD